MKMEEEEEEEVSGGFPFARRLVTGHLWPS